MNKLVATNILHAAFVGIICGIVIGAYALIGPAGMGLVQVPYYWACFIVIPVIFMAGGEWKQMPMHWANLLLGMVLGGWLCFFFVGNTVVGLGLPVAFGVGTAVTTLIVQGIATSFIPGGLKPAWGFCPMAFIGMIAVFASATDAYDLTPYITVAVSLFVGVITATAMAQSGKLAAKITGLNQEQSQEQAAQAEAVA